MDPVVVVHGGAGGRVSQDREERVRQGVARAAAAGYRVLTEGGSALDAVEGAVAALEDDPEFNAGAFAPRRPAEPRPEGPDPWAWGTRCARGRAACSSFLLTKLL